MATPAVRAVLFDFGGTLYDYATLEPGDRECVVALARWSGIVAGDEEIRRAYRAAIRLAFLRYLPRPFYLHRDLFRDAAVGMLESFGVPSDAEKLERYRHIQWERHARDLVLRPGVVETLRALRKRGLHVGLVSNIDDDQLDHLIGAAGVRGEFDSLLSSEAARSCKPDPAIFAEALRRAGCAAGEALFVGDTVLQDIAGANSAGLHSVLLWHRLDRPPEFDSMRPAHVIHSIPALLELVDQV